MYTIPFLMDAAACLLWPSSSLPNLPFLSTLATSSPVVYLWKKGLALHSLEASTKSCRFPHFAGELNAIEETGDSYLHLLLFAATIQEVSNSCRREAASVVRSL